VKFCRNGIEKLKRKTNSDFERAAGASRCRISGRSAASRRQAIAVRAALHRAKQRQKRAQRLRMPDAPKNFDSPILTYIVPRKCRSLFRKKAGGMSFARNPTMAPPLNARPASACVHAQIGTNAISSPAFSFRRFSSSARAIARSQSFRKFEQAKFASPGSDTLRS
jgi:hypothetical protein